MRNSSNVNGHLQSERTLLMNSIKLGHYKHYRGNSYQVLGLCRHSETLEECVVYQALYDDFGLWVRPKSMFFGAVEVGSQTVKRFKYLGPIQAKSPTLR